MTKFKRIGIILILIGVCIPLVSFVFATGYNPHFGFWWSVTRMNINLWQKTVIEPEAQRGDVFDKITPERKKGFVPLEEAPAPQGLTYLGETLPETLPETYVTLPYKYPFSLGIIFVLSGIGIFTLIYSGDRRT